MGGLHRGAYRSRAGTFKGLLKKGYPPIWSLTLLKLICIASFSDMRLKLIDGVFAAG